MSIQFTDNYSVFNGTVTATTTSTAIDVSKRQLVSLQFIAAGGSSVFTIDASNDGSTWTTGIAFLNATATATGTSVVTSGSLSSTSMIAIVPPNFRYIRVVATYTSGTADAILEAKG